MKKKKAKKELDRAENRLQNAQDKLKRAEDKQGRAEAKADEKDVSLNPAQAKKLSASIREEQKNVEKAEKELARAQKRHARASGSDDIPEAEHSADIAGLTVHDAASAIEAALKDNAAVSVTGTLEITGDALTLELPAGAAILWKASLAANCPTGALVLRSASDGSADSGQPAPIFCVAEEGVVSNTAQEGCAVIGDGITVKVDGGLVRSLHGDGIRTDGLIEVLDGVIAAGGASGRAAQAVHGSEIRFEGGFVLGQAPNKAEAGNGDLSKAAVVEPADADALKEGSSCVCVWVTDDEAMPNEDGAETGLTYWPEDACVWWDVAPDGETSIYAGRQKQSNSVLIGHQNLPKPPDMRTAGNGIVALPIVFEAKTDTSERPVLLSIEWGWDLFLGRKGASQYDNRLAIAACALSNSVYHEDEINELLQQMGFLDPVLKNYGDINATSAFALAHAQITDGRREKTIFAVVNRGSKTLMDWKGNIIDETIQDAQFFGRCADTVASALKDYVRKFGQKKPDDNLFFITGHSLGAIVTDLLAAQDFEEYPARNVYAYSFAAPLADPAAKVDESRPIYNILNQNDAITSFPPRPGYKRVGTDNFTFSTRGKNAAALARPFRFLSHMDIEALAHMSSITGFFKKAVPSILWNHSLTTYMAYLLAGGPDSVKESKGLWSVVQNIITAAGGQNDS